MDIREEREREGYINKGDKMECMRKPKGPISEVHLAPLVYGKKYRLEPIRLNTTNYIPSSIFMRAYFGIEKGDDYTVNFVPDVNSKGMRFLGLWFERGPKAEARMRRRTLRAMKGV